MNAVQMHWLTATLQSLCGSTNLTVYTPEYNAELSRINSIYDSRRTIEFGANPHPITTITITDKKYSLALDRLPEDPPYPVRGKYLSSWNEVGIIPSKMLRELIGILEEWNIDISGDAPFRRVWIAMPDVVTWFHYKPVYGFVKDTSLAERRTLKTFFQSGSRNANYSSAGVTEAREPFAEIGDVKFFTTLRLCDFYPPFIFDGVEVGRYEQDKCEQAKSFDPYGYKVYCAQYDENRRIIFAFFKAEFKTQVWYEDKEVLTLNPDDYVIGKLID